MSDLGYHEMQSGLLLPLAGPPDLRPRSIKVPIKNGKAHPYGAIIMHGSIIGASREGADKYYRDRGYEPTFVEVK